MMIRSLLTACVIAGSLVAQPRTARAHGDEGHAHAAATGIDYAAKSTGTRLLTAGPVSIKILADAANLGRGDIEVGELLLPPEAAASPPHQHGSLEIFYVVDGVLGHDVNGVQHRLEPGEVGIVKPGDTVIHTVLSKTAVKAVVIWVPGGEADNLIKHAGFSAAPLP